MVRTAMAAALICGSGSGATASEHLPPIEPTLLLETLELEGAERTRRPTIAALLPRPLPARLSRSELDEFERRLRNLAIFDDVSVATEGDRLSVRVREKLTLTPAFDLATGRTLADTYIAIGAVEHNVLGRAAALELWASWEERGPNGGLALREHPYAPGRWALTAEVYYTAAALRFEEPALSSWERRWLGVEASLSPPLYYGLPARLAGGLFYVREQIAETETARHPRDSVRAWEGAPGGSRHWIGALLLLERDRYTWDDLAPRGYRLTLEIVPGLMLPKRRARHSAHFQALTAIALGDRSALLARGRLEGSSRGDANHSLLLGSQEGVRGLADPFHRSWAQAFANIELRTALRFVARWALQGVLFADAAIFQPIGPDGRSLSPGHAVGVGAGARLLPTALTELVLRLDLARLLLPAPSWFLQLGASQYF
jgi:hypothetical protein